MKKNYITTLRLIYLGIVIIGCTLSNRNNALLYIVISTLLLIDLIDRCLKTTNNKTILIILIIMTIITVVITLLNMFSYFS